MVKIFRIDNLRIGKTFYTRTLQDLTNLTIEEYGIDENSIVNIDTSRNSETRIIYIDKQ